MTAPPDRSRAVLDPAAIDAVIFDLDGALMGTARLDSMAWQELFDNYRAERELRGGAPFPPFDPVVDYGRYVDGRACQAGVAAFLESRGIALLEGEEADPPTAETVWGLANRKDGYFRAALSRRGLPVPASSVALVRALLSGGVRTAVVSGSRDADEVLAMARLDGLFEVLVDGVEADRMGLAGKPEPAQLLEAAHRLGLAADRVAVVEGTISGVQAARAGGFALVIGVDRAGQAKQLFDAGAGSVVSDLSDVTVRRTETCCPSAGRPAPSWVLVFDGYEPADEGRRETLCATGNGYMATRAAAPEALVSEAGYPGTYLAGVYNRLVSRVHGRALEHEELVNAPNWLALTFRIGDGEWFGAPSWERLGHRQELDIRHGILTRELRLRDPGNRVTLVTQRQFTSMADPHLAALQVTIVPENWSGTLQVRSSVDGAVTNSGVAEYRLLAARHLATLSASRVDDETDVLTAQTVRSGVNIALASRFRSRGTQAAAPATARCSDDRVDRVVSLEARAGEPLVVEKTVAVFTSRDHAIAECTQAALTRTGRAPDYPFLVAAHRRAWETLWSRAWLWVDVDDRAALIANLHVFHLLQSVSPHTTELDAGVTARGLHGEAYRGHVFWDELFIFPFLNFRFPELTRSLLLYRYRRLGEARALAAACGFEGAMFPWQSGTDGREETPEYLYNVRSGRWMRDNSRLQRHVGLAIAYNVWSYYQVTNDLQFMQQHGAEMLIEVSRFWAGLAQHDATRDRYDIRGVMGPDEFHDGPPGAPGSGLSNNAYTNVMVAWLLWRTREAIDVVTGHFGGELCSRLQLDDDELSRWDDVSRKLTVPFDRAGRLAQFEGYEDLEEFDWSAYRSRVGNIGRLDLVLEAEGDSTNRYKLSKQADVLMLFYLLTAEEIEALLARLGYRFDPATIPETVHYYLERTSHGSTLSRVVSAWVLARTDRERSWQLLVDALAADIDDTQSGTTAEGIHLGAMAGTVDLLQRCYSGLAARDGVLHLNPRLPDALPRLRFVLDYHSQRIEVDITHTTVTVRARPSAAPPVRIAVRDEQFELGGDMTRTVPLERKS